MADTLLALLRTGLKAPFLMGEKFCGVGRPCIGVDSNMAVILTGVEGVMIIVGGSTSGIVVFGGEGVEIEVVT